MNNRIHNFRAGLKKAKLYLTLLLLGNCIHANAAIINLTLYNEDPLVDMSSTPLLGNALSGDLVQLLTPGLDGMIDIVNVYNGIADDDVLFASSDNPTHVGAGTFTPANDTGVLSQVMEFEESLIGEQVYIRFWDTSSISTATAYGQTALFTIPTELFPGEVFLNFNPSGAGSLMTTVPFDYLGGSIPEPGALAFLLLATLIFIVRFKYKSATVKPQAYYMNELSIEVSA